MELFHLYGSTSWLRRFRFVLFGLAVVLALTGCGGDTGGGEVLNAGGISAGTDPPDAKPIQAELSWAPSDDPAVNGYIIYYGRESRYYENSVELGLKTSHAFTDLEPHNTYYFTVTASSRDSQSDFSEEVSKFIP